MMSTTKNTPLKILFSILLLSASFSCDTKKEKQTVVQKSPNEIIRFSVSQIGGTLGNYRIIKVTEDSIFAEKGATTNQLHKEWASPISEDTWKKLIAPVNIKDLDSIKSSPSRQSVNGTDETFQIHTPKKSYIYVNSYVDTLRYKQLQQIKEQLEQILPKEYQ